MKEDIAYRIMGSELTVYTSDGPITHKFSCEKELHNRLPKIIEAAEGDRNADAGVFNED